MTSKAENFLINLHPLVDEALINDENFDNEITQRKDRAELS